MDKNIERLLDTKSIGKTVKHREIEDAFSLLNLPENIDGYHTHPKKDYNKKIQAFEWCLHFGNPIFHSLTEAGKVNCFKRESAMQNSVVIYSLNFANDSELDEVMDKFSIEKWFIGYEEPVIQCLRKDNYVIGILIDKELKKDLKLFEGFYTNNFGMKKI